MGNTFEFTLRWEMTWCSLENAALIPFCIDKHAVFHHFVVTRDRTKAFNVLSHFSRLEPANIDDAFYVSGQLGSRPFAVYDKHRSAWLSVGDPANTPLEVSAGMQAALQRFVPAATHGTAVSLVPLQVGHTIPEGREGRSALRPARALLEVLFGRAIPNIGYATEAAKDSVRLVSYNIWNVNEFDQGTYHERMERLIGHVAALDPSIIAFQEVRHDAQRASQPRQLSAALPGYDFVFVPAMSYPEQIFHRVEEGVAVFSKFPIVGVKTILLPRNRHNHHDAHQRIVLRVSVDTGAMGIFHIFVSHFALDEGARVRACRDVWNFMNQTSATEILLGDLNAEPDGDCIRFLSGRGELEYDGARHHTDLYDAFLAHHAEPRPGNKYSGDAEARDYGLTFNTFGDHLVKRIDYALLKHPGNLQVAEISVFPEEREEAPSSDHLGLVLDLVHLGDNSPPSGPLT